MYKSTKKAFSLLELVFVIVILGIVASIGSSVIVKVYESYLVQRAVHRASLKTELAVNILANRLAYRIDTSLIAHNPGNFGAGDMLPLRGLPTANANTHTALEWIGYENDGFSTTTPPAWSGFVDLTHANTDFNGFETPASQLLLENTILGHLFQNMGNPAMIFRAQNYHNNLGGDTPYDANCMHRINNVPGCMFPLGFNPNATTFAFAAVGNPDRAIGMMLYTEHYQLAASAYAVVPEPDAGRRTPNNTLVWDLFFYSDYQPWERALPEDYRDGVKTLLLPNVSVFRFTQEANSIRIKICSIESIEGTDISICKEKAVIR